MKKSVMKVFIPLSWYHQSWRWNATPAITGNIFSSRPILNMSVDKKSMSNELETFVMWPRNKCLLYRLWHHQIRDGSRSRRVVEKQTFSSGSNGLFSRLINQWMYSLTWRDVYALIAFMLDHINQSPRKSINLFLNVHGVRNCQIYHIDWSFQRVPDDVSCQDGCDRDGPYVFGKRSKLICFKTHFIWRQRFRNLIQWTWLPISEKPSRQTQGYATQWYIYTSSSLFTAIRNLLLINNATANHAASMYPLF